MDKIFLYVLNPGSILIVLIIVMLISILLFGMNKMNVSMIIKNHIKTLRNSNEKDISISDIFIFFCLPFLMAIMIGKIKIIDENLLNMILTIFSIFTGLLFNLLILILDKKNIKDNKSIDQDYNVLIDELYDNISFNTFVSIIIVIFTFIYSFMQNINLFIDELISYIIYFFVIIFIMTLFMILKRIYVVFKYERN